MLYRLGQIAGLIFLALLFIAFVFGMLGAAPDTDPVNLKSSTEVIQYSLQNFIS